MPTADGPARETWNALSEDERREVYAAWQADTVARYQRDADWTRQRQVDERAPRVAADAVEVNENQMTLEVRR